MHLRQVEYAVAVAEHGSFTKAAAAVHMAQPSLSHAVRALEDDLGVALFIRARRSVTLSPAGEVFLPQARQLLRDSAAVRTAVEAVTDVVTGRLDLVSLSTLAVDPLVDLVGAFRTSHPGVLVRIAQPEHADAVVTMVRDGRCDIGLTELPVAGEITVHKVLTQQIMVVCPPGTTPPAKPLSVRELAAMPLITTPPGTSTRRLLDEALAGVALSATIVVETDQREAIVPLVLAGAGVTVLPEGMARRAASEGAVVAGLHPPIRRHIGLVHRRGAVSPAAARFLALSLARLGASER